MKVKKVNKQTWAEKNIAKSCLVKGIIWAKNYHKTGSKIHWRLRRWLRRRRRPHRRDRGTASCSESSRGEPTGEGPWVRWRSRRCSSRRGGSGRRRERWGSRGTREISAKVKTGQLFINFRYNNFCEVAFNFTHPVVFEPANAQPHFIA